MLPETHTASFESLLENADWLRRLARSLVLDDARADDLLQDVWLAALRFPVEETTARGWLRKVLIQKLSRTYASDQSRWGREERAVQEANDAGESAGERSLRLRGIHDEVLSLEEPYREVILLRFFENLPPREISKRTGVPVNTVRTHVRRGLEQLRTKLDGEYGDRANWSSALIPLAFTDRQVLWQSARVSSMAGMLFAASFLLAVPVALGLYFNGGVELEVGAPDSGVAGSILNPADALAADSPENQAGADLASHPLVGHRPKKEAETNQDDRFDNDTPVTADSAPLAPPGPIQADSFGVSSVISTNARPVMVRAADLNGDGHADVLTTSADGDVPPSELGTIAWHENDGYGVIFGAQRIICTGVGWRASAQAFDLDNDGDLDILFTSQSDDEIGWIENQGSGVFGEKQTIEIMTTATPFLTADAADLDGDGYLDALSASFKDGRILWYRNIESASFAGAQVVTLNAKQVIAIDSADVDGDGDVDVLFASPLESSQAHKIVWFPNDGLGGFGIEQVITTEATHATDVHACDLDGDGDLDVLFESKNSIAWYENQGSGDLWMKREIASTESNRANSVHACDLDMDGDLDVLATYFDARVVWHENLGSGVFGPEQVVSETSQGAVSVDAADLDGDGDPDVLSAEAGSFGGKKWPTRQPDRIRSFENVAGPQSYCPLTPNSAGPGAKIGVAGSVSVSANNLVIKVSGVPPAQVGFFYYGTAQVQVPFDQGNRCVGGTIVHPWPLSFANASGRQSQAVNNTSPDIANSPVPLDPGSTRNFQYWFRDQAGGSSGYNLSDAIEVVFVP